MGVAAVGHIGDRFGALAAGQPDRQNALDIDIADLLALPEIGDHRVAGGGLYLEGHADAGAAPVEPEDEARPFGGAAVDEGIDAERAPVAVKPGPAGLDIVEARPPDQRTVAKHPKIAHIAKPECGADCASHRKGRCPGNG